MSHTSSLLPSPGLQPTLKEWEVVLCLLNQGEFTQITWNSLLWKICLFSSINVFNNLFTSIWTREYYFILGFIVQYYCIVLCSNSLMTNDIEHDLIILTCHLYILFVRCLFKPFALFKMGSNLGLEASCVCA